MGLDMYLYAERYRYASGIRGDLDTVVYPEDLKDLGERAPFKSTTERYLIGYWRKAHAIHDWIVQNCAGGVDECQTIQMSREDILQLRNACMDVMANPDSAPDILPVFDDSYDDWYREQLQYTVKLLDDVIHLVDAKPQWGIVYQASW